MPTPTSKTTRTERLAQPLAREVAEQIAADKGVCIHPVSLRRINIATGATEVIDVPCRATLESRCPACAKRKRSLRRTQCEEGWHLATEPVVEPDPPTNQQRAWVEQRAMVTAERGRLAATGSASAEELSALDAAIADLDEEITASGLRDSVTRSADSSGSSGSRRVRSTKRRQDVPDLPKRPMTRKTVGRPFTDPNTGKVFRPSLFITLTLDSYGRVRSDGTPVDPSTYDYRRAARDTLHPPEPLSRSACACAGQPDPFPNWSFRTCAATWTSTRLRGRTGSCSSGRAATSSGGATSRSTGPTPARPWAWRTSTSTT
jgi:hypothetical protein